VKFITQPTSPFELHLKAVKRNIQNEV